MAGGVSRMAKPTKTLSANYEKAEAVAAASAEAVAQVSKNKLSAIMALSHRERFDHLRDPLLTPADARALTQSLRTATTPNWTPPVSSRFRRWRPRLSFRFFVSPAMIALMAMTAAYAAFVWARTPQKVTLTRTVAVALLDPDGVRRITHLNPGTVFFLVRNDGNEVVIRPLVSTVVSQEVVVPASIVKPAD